MDSGGCEMAIWELASKFIYLPIFKEFGKHFSDCLLLLLMLIVMFDSISASSLPFMPYNLELKKYNLIGVKLIYVNNQFQTFHLLSLNCIFKKMSKK